MALLKKSNTATTPASNQNAMQQLNGYMSWLSSKGIKNISELNKGDEGIKMMEMYRKENPSFTLTKDDIGAIQQNITGKQSQPSMAAVKTAISPLAPSQTAAVGAKAAEVQGAVKAAKTGPKFSLKKK